MKKKKKKEKGKKKGKLNVIARIRGRKLFLKKIKKVLKKFRYYNGRYYTLILIEKSY